MLWIQTLLLTLALSAPVVVAYPGQKQPPFPKRAEPSGYDFLDVDLPSSRNQTSSFDVQANDDAFYYDLDNWTLHSRQLQNNSFAVQPYTANGYIGTRITTQGHGFAFDKNITDPNGTIPINGWPLDNPRFAGAYVAGFWDSQHNTTRTNFPDLLKQGGESVISTVPQWTSFYIRDLQSNATYNPNTTASQVSNYDQSLSLRNGIVQTNLTWSPSPNSQYNLSYTIFAHRARANLGVVRVEITAPRNATNATIDLIDLLDGEGSMRTEYLDSGLAFEPAIYTGVTPIGLRNVSAFEYSTVWFSNTSSVDLSYRNMSNANNAVNSSTISQQFRVRLRPGETFTAIKYVGIASSDAFDEPFAAAKGASQRAIRAGWSTLVEEHDKAWQQIWNSASITVPGNPQLQLSIAASIFHLVANVRDGSEGRGLGDNSISVGGLSSDSYAGFIFWDADLWMYPGLQALHPNFGASIVNYRQKLHDQARANIATYNLTTSNTQNFTGAIYPWTSSRFGNCTSTGPCFDYQYHLNTDIAFAQWNYYLSTNDTEWLQDYGYPLMKDAANMFASYVIRNETTQGQYWTFNLTDPDEYANHINNGAYTNAGIAQIMSWTTQAAEILGEQPDPKWMDIANNIYVPRDPSLNLVLEYATMNNSVEVKQADVVLLTYPLEYPNITAEEALASLQYYAAKQSPDGPAMTYAVYAIDVAQLATEGCGAYTYLMAASQPYLREPFYQFSEQIYDNATINGGTNPAFPFLTGHGGFLQVFTHGLTGYRPRNNTLYLDPTLPPQLEEGVIISGLKYQGGVFDIDIQLNHTTISRRNDWTFSDTDGIILTDDNTPINITIGSRNSQAGNYTLSVNETLTVGTFRPDLNTSSPIQCKPVLSSDPWIGGQFPFAVNDGDMSTSWQPSTPNKSFITIDLGNETEISSANFVWGRSTPQLVSLGVIPSNATTLNFTAAAETNATNLTITQQQWILTNEKVELSSPYNQSTNISVFTMPSGNISSFDFSNTYIGRYLVVGIEGNYDSTSEGGSLVELTIA